MKVVNRLLLPVLVLICLAPPLQAQAPESSYLDEIVNLINEQFTDADKQFVLVKLWQVAFADGVIDDGEEAFIQSVANTFGLTDADIQSAREKASP